MADFSSHVLKLAPCHARYHSKALVSFPLSIRNHHFSICCVAPVTYNDLMYSDVMYNDVMLL